MRPPKKFIKKKPTRLLLREAVQRAEAPDQIHGVNADGQKCERCWHWEQDIGQNAEHPIICGRCVEAVK